MSKTAGDCFRRAVHVSGRIAVAQNGRRHVCSRWRLISLLHDRLLRRLLRFHCRYRIADMPENEHDYHQTKTTSGDDSSADELFIVFQIHLIVPSSGGLTGFPTASNEFPGCLKRLLSPGRVPKSHCLPTHIRPTLEPVTRI